MTSTRLKNKGGWGRVKRHGPLICFQQRSGTLSERVRLMQVGREGALRRGGVKALSLAVADGFLTPFSLRIPPMGLGQIDSIISNRALSLYELIKDAKKQGDLTDICHCARM